MKSIKYWAKCIVMDAFMASLFVLWKGYGIDGAGNVFLTLVWVGIVIGLIAGFSADKTSFKTKRPAGFLVYHRLTDFACICALAFYGMFVTAALMATAHLMLEAAREREPKAVPEKEAA